MQLKPFISGDSVRTSLSASVMNEIVDAINVILLGRGENGIEVTIAEGGMTIGFDQETTDALDRVKEGAGSGTGSLNWLGDWTASTPYQVGDIVVRATSHTETDPNESPSKAGTFVCIQAHTASTGNEPPKGVNLSNEYWETMADGRWPHLWSYDQDAPTAGYVHAHGGDVTIDFGSRTTNGTTNAKLLLDASTLSDATLFGRTFKPIKVAVCVDGLSKSMWVLGTEAF